MATILREPLILRKFLGSNHKKLRYRLSLPQNERKQIAKRYERENLRQLVCATGNNQKKITTCALMATR